MAKAKGTTLLGAVKFLRSNRERALAVLPEALHPYLSQRINESSWYPEEDLLGLVRAMIRLLPGERTEILAMMGARTARDHLGGVYAHLRGRGDAEGASRRAFALWASQHDSGRFTVNHIGSGEIEMAVTDFALPSEEMCAIFAGYFEELHRLEGRRNIRSEKIECVRGGDPRCAWQLRYDDGPS